MGRPLGSKRPRYTIRVGIRLKPEHLEMLKMVAGDTITSKIRLLIELYTKQGKLNV